MNGSIGRDQIQVGLRPNVWTAVLAKMEDPFVGVQGGFNTLAFSIYSDFLNEGNVELKIQDSDDGVVWTDVYDYETEITPGGVGGFQGWHTRKYFRLVCRSTAPARIYLTVARMNPSENPALWTDSAGLWIY